MLELCAVLLPRELGQVSSAHNVWGRTAGGVVGHVKAGVGSVVGGMLRVVDVEASKGGVGVYIHRRCLFTPTEKTVASRCRRT